MSNPIINKLKKTHSLFLLVGFTVLFTLLELSYRALLNITAITNIPAAFGCWFIVVTAILFVRSKILSLGFLIFTIFGIVINYLHYAFYKSWISSTEYLLIFDNVGELVETSLSMFSIFIAPLVFSLFTGYFLIIVFKCRKKTSYLVDIFVYLLFAFVLLRAVVNAKHARDGLFPGNNMPVLNIHFMVSGIFLGKVLPDHLLNKGAVAVYLKKAPNIKSQPKIKNIIWVQGESQNISHMSVFGYQRKTTPFFSAFKQQHKNAVIKPAFSSGTFTNISINSLFNALAKPSGEKQAASYRTNLFRLAKQQEYHTEFRSVQAETGMKLMSGVGLNWIDIYTNSMHSGYDDSDSMPDRKLLEVFDFNTLDKGRNFIVLHQRGSHTPYEVKGTDVDNHFGKETMTGRYDNTIVSTDRLLKDIYTKLSQRKEKDWILIFTSDHGELVTEDKIGHGFFDAEVYRVPIFIYTPIASIQKKIKVASEKCRYMNHQQLPTLVMSLMGYDETISDCNISYVNGTLLSGMSGYMYINQRKNIERLIMPE